MNTGVAAKRLSRNRKVKHFFCFSSSFKSSTVGPKDKQSGRIFYYYLFSIRVSLVGNTHASNAQLKGAPDEVGLSFGVCQISGFLPSLRRLACRTMGLNCFSRIDARTSSWLSHFSDDVMSTASKACQQLVKHDSMRLECSSSSASIPLESMRGHRAASVLVSRHGFRWLVRGHICR